MGAMLQDNSKWASTDASAATMYTTGQQVAAVGVSRAADYLTAVPAASLGRPALELSAPTASGDRCASLASPLP